MRAMKTSQTAAILVALGGSVVMGAQSGPTTMNQEPHHTRHTYIRHMRVFEINLPPGESTSDYLLDHDVAIVTLADGVTRSRKAGADWSVPQSRSAATAELVEYTGTPVTTRMENVGQGPFRAFVVENLRDAGWSRPAVIRGAGTTIRQESRSFGVYDMRLSAQTPRIVHVHENPSFVFVISGAVQAQGGGGESEFRLDQLGRWFPTSGPDQPHTVSLAGGGEAHVVCVEVR
jgi:hypothetical protein